MPIRIRDADRGLGKPPEVFVWDLAVLSGIVALAAGRALRVLGETRPRLGHPGAPTCLEGGGHDALTLLTPHPPAQDTVTGPPHGIARFSPPLFFFQLPPLSGCQGDGKMVDAGSLWLSRVFTGDHRLTDGQMRPGVRGRQPPSQRLSSMWIRPRLASRLLVSTRDCRTIAGSLIVLDT